MKVIEEQMVLAVVEMRNVTLGDTTVRVSVDITNQHKVARVRLWGNLIAEVDRDAKDVTLNQRVIEDFPTRTTLSRLNSLWQGLFGNRPFYVDKGRVCKVDAVSDIYDHAWPIPPEMVPSWL